MRKVPSGSNIPAGTFFYACKKVQNHIQKFCNGSIPQLFGEYFHSISSLSTPFIFDTKRINH